jgi:hypothetical protein
MYMNKSYAKDTQFWEMLSWEVGKRGTQTLGSDFEALNLKVSERNLPVIFGGLKSYSWAAVCQIFLIYQDHMNELGRNEYLSMLAGAKRVFRTASFVRLAIRRIVANVATPSTAGRTMRQSVADTFFANGLTVTEDYKGPSMDAHILSQALDDTQIMHLCDLIVSPPLGIWEAVTGQYAKNRPSLLYRKSKDLYSWIFDR